jgi:H+/Cl- antiporter ClcA
VGAVIAAVVGEYTSAGFQCTESSSYCVAVWGEFAFSLSNVFETYFKPWELPLFLVLGAIIGLISVGIAYLILLIGTMYRRFPSKLSQLMQVSLVFTLTIIFFSLCSVPFECEVETMEFPIGSSLCPPGQFNPVASLLLDSPLTAIRSLFSPRTDFASLVLLATFFITLIPLVFTAAGLSVPAGLFIPLVLCGSLLGRFFGTVLPATSPAVYAICGAASLLSGVSRMTLWVGVVMIESSSQIELSIPIILAVVSSKFVSDSLMHDSLYERAIRAKKIRFLPPVESKKSSNRSVQDVMTSPVIAVIFDSETVSSICTLLNQFRFRSFPVVSLNGDVLGMVSRETLGIACEAIQSEQTADSEMSVTPIARSTVIRISPTESFDTAYFLFTTLGLSMLMVTDDSNRLVGVLTRTDMA